MNVKQYIKDRLVALGPEHPLVHSALRLHAFFSGFRISFGERKIAIRRSNQTLILSDRDYTLVPITMECFSLYFQTIEAKPFGTEMVLDFSLPGVHKYLQSGLALAFPGIAEDDSIDAYTRQFKPGEGMVVFDVGAHAGLTTCSLSRMVGDTGHVYAFEPDETSRHYLVQNMETLGLKNVTVSDMAFGDRSGHALFNMDGSMGAGLVEFTVYPNTGRQAEVEVVTIEECCRRFGCVPEFIKMDIEGAEVEVVRSSLDFLRETPINFAFDSYHRTREGSLTCYELEKLFRSIGYQVESADVSGQIFTWAAPGPGSR